jgi:hypothetical protein
VSPKAALLSDASASPLFHSRTDRHVPAHHFNQTLIALFSEIRHLEDRAYLTRHFPGSSVCLSYCFPCRVIISYFISLPVSVLHRPPIHLFVYVVTLVVDLVTAKQFQTAKMPLVPNSHIQNTSSIIIHNVTVSYIYSEGRDSTVGIVTRYELDGPGTESRSGRNFPHSSRRALGPTLPPIRWVSGHFRG